MPKILLIEDEERMSEYLKEGLTKRGFEVLVALTGKQAQELYHKEKPEVILLDLGLPDMDGRDLLKNIKVELPQTKIIVISAYKSQDTRQELLRKGADYFLGKPFLPPALYELLEKISQK